MNPHPNKPQKSLSLMFNNAAEFLRTVESVEPLGLHVKFQEPWKDSVEAFAEESEVFSPQLEALVAFRLQVHSAALKQAGAHAEGAPDDWKWLLEVNQVQQRTPEWYAETRNLLTGSEVGKLFQGPGSWNAMVKTKAEGQPPLAPAGPLRLAVMRSETNPMDWGTRYEACVKGYLEKTLGATIQDLGRIKHRQYANLAVSPDGLFTSATDPALVGRLVEIKCPKSRTPDGTISSDYWCQMQWQMEICDRPACEFVEVQFRELEANAPPTEGALDRGWITLQTNTETDENRYVYINAHPLTPTPQEDAWADLETYQWEIITVRRQTVLRDTEWFKKSQPTFEKFWKEVDDARSGTWQPLPVKQRKQKEAPPPTSKCVLLDDDLDPETLQSLLANGEGVVNVTPDKPEPPSYTD